MITCRSLNDRSNNNGIAKKKKKKEKNGVMKNKIKSDCALLILTLNFHLEP